jgi:hypothetical protein
MIMGYNNFLFYKHHFFFNSKINNILLYYLQVFAKQAQTHTTPSVKRKFVLYIDRQGVKRRENMSE